MNKSDKHDYCILVHKTFLRSQLKIESCKLQNSSDLETQWANASFATAVISENEHFWFSSDCSETIIHMQLAMCHEKRSAQYRLKK